MATMIEDGFELRPMEVYISDYFFFFLVQILDDGSL